MRSRFLRTTRVARLWLAGSIAILVPSLGQAEIANPSEFVINSDIERTPPLVGAELESELTDTAAYISAMIAQSQRDYRSAAQFMTQLAADPDASLFLLDLQHSLLSVEGQIEAAKPIAERLFAADVANGFAVRTLYSAAMNQGDYAKALEWAVSLPNAGFFSLVRPVSIAWANVGLGKTEEAVAALDPLMESESTAEFAQTQTALIDWVAGDKASAVTSLTALAGEDLRSVSTRLAMLSILAQANDPNSEAAQVYLESLTDQDFDGPRVLQDAFKALLDGETLAFPVISPQQGIAEALENLGASFSSDGQGGDLGLALINTALYFNPNHNEARLVQGEVYAAREQYDQAIEMLALVQGLPSLVYAADYEQAQALVELERVDEALVLLKDMSERAPERWASLELKGNVLRNRDDFDNAIAAYTEVEQRIISDGGPRQGAWRFYYSWGVAHDQNDDWALAEEKFLKALELEEEQPNVMNYVAYSWVDRGFEERYDQALSMLERAVELRPSSGFIIDSLAWIQFKLGDYENALVNMERAVELTPADPILNDHLGDVYWKNGREEEAVFQWKRALSFEPDDKDQQRILRKLDVGLGQVEQEEATEDKDT